MRRNMQEVESQLNILNLRGLLLKHGLGRLAKLISPRIFDGL